MAWLHSPAPRESSWPRGKEHLVQPLDVPQSLAVCCARTSSSSQVTRLGVCTLAAHAAYCSSSSRLRRECKRSLNPSGSGNVRSSALSTRTFRVPSKIAASRARYHCRCNSTILFGYPCNSEPWLPTFSEQMSPEKAAYRSKRSDQVAQLKPRAHKACLHGSLANAENICGFGRTQLTHVP